MSSRTKLRASALKRTLAMIRPHIKGHRALMAGGVTALLFEVIFRVLEPWPTKFVVDAVTASLGAQVSGAQPATISLLVACAVAVVVIVGLRALSNYLATVAFALAGSRIATRLRAGMFDHVHKLERSFHARSKSGDIVQRLVADVGKLQEVAVTAGLPLIANVVTLLVMAVVMIVIDPLLAMVVVFAAGAFWLSLRGSAGKITHAARKTRQGEGELATVAQESLGAINVVHAYGLEEEIGKKFAGSNQRTLKDGVKAKRLAAGLERRTDVIVGVATALVLAAGGWRVMSGSMSPGDLVIFLTYLKTAMKPLRDLAKYTGRIARASASGERIADLLDVVPQIANAAGAHTVVRSAGNLRFDNVWFSYDDGTPVLKGVNLEVHPGQRVAIVGPSGSGKSTFSQLVPRLIDPDRGSVSLDGVDVRGLDLESLRQNVSLVLQESVLFSGTIAENIRYGRITATANDIESAARQAGAHDFIMALPDGYNTVVGERGGTLSGGQRQRIAIARAMLRNSSVIVLDEATTGLDPASTSAVMKGLDVLTAGKTTLAVTHDAHMALSCDRVIWVENGYIQLDGSPAELMRNNKFATWVASQQQVADQALLPQGLS